MALIAFVAGIRVRGLSGRSPATTFHARFGEYEATVSVATGELLEGSLPRSKAEALKRWHMEDEDEIAYLWQQVQDKKSRYAGSTDEVR